MNILSIGNGFSEDAQRYLHEIAVPDGFDLDTYNIVFGGCSLSMHYENMTGKANPYYFYKNSKSIKKHKKRGNFRQCSSLVQGFNGKGYFGNRFS